LLAKRIIPCLDIKDGQTVKGIRFEQLRSAGDPVELAAQYALHGADELVFLDITATHDGRDALLFDLVERIAAVLDIPFTVGGGISSANQVEALLRAGADKVSINSAAFRRPELVDELALAFGSQCVVVAIDTNAALATSPTEEWIVYLNGGRLATERTTLDWVREVCDRGAGEILLTSMANDGTKDGFATGLTRAVADSVLVPVIASGGAGTMAHFVEVFEQGGADAALAASVFHFGEIPISTLKKHLTQHGIAVRNT
jgi:imidazole glycerol-phosphate synthase subunit HisF